MFATTVTKSVRYGLEGSRVAQLSSLIHLTGPWLVGFFTNSGLSVFQTSPSSMMAQVSIRLQGRVLRLPLCKSYQSVPSVF